jgi:hypothetical protein
MEMALDMLWWWMMSLTDKDWTIFMIDAEVECFGTARIVEEHNTLRRAVSALTTELATCQQQRDRLAAKAALAELDDGFPE